MEMLPYFPHVDLCHRGALSFLISQAYNCLFRRHEVRTWQIKSAKVLSTADFCARPQNLWFLSVTNSWSSKIQKTITVLLAYLHLPPTLYAHLFLLCNSHVFFPLPWSISQPPLVDVCLPFCSVGGLSAPVHSVCWVCLRAVCVTFL